MGRRSDQRFGFQSRRANSKAVKLGVVSRLLKQWVVAPPVRDEAFETDWVAGAA